MLLSIVTPTYNRENFICRSLDSSLELVKFGFFHEVIVVDDASTDNTVSIIKIKYNDEINNNILRLIELEKNIGVTGAKNKGAEFASGDWLLFMDSDDIFLPNVGERILKEIQTHNEYDIIFFRCLDIESKLIIGQTPRKYDINIKELINAGTPGECLPAVNRKKFLSNPYTEDLRGCESITYIEMASSGSKILISDIIARGYRSNGLDRLSTRKNIFARSEKMYKYNKLLLQFVKQMNTKTTTVTLIKLFAYYLISKIYPKLIIN